MSIVVYVTLVLFGISGLVKLVGLPMSLEQRDALRVPPALWRVIGVFEVLGVLGVVAAHLAVVPHWVGTAAAVGFVVLIFGALSARLRAQSPAALIALDVVTLALAVATFFALR